MLSKLVLAIVVFIVVGLGLTYLLGPFLLSLAVPFLAIFGEFFEKWGLVLAACAGLWTFFSGWRPW